VYREADIYLVDDILCELDAAMVGKLVEDVFLGDLLKSKTRVLVSNQLPAVKAADLLVLLEEGTIHQGGGWSQVFHEEACPEDHTAGLIPIAVQRVSCQSERCRIAVLQPSQPLHFDCRASYISMEVDFSCYPVLSTDK
jgi:ABC-type sulfate/molybdate transport systems ATPase subunit